MHRRTAVKSARRSLRTAGFHRPHSAPVRYLPAVPASGPAVPVRMPPEGATVMSERGKPSRASRVEMTEIVMPADTNQHDRVWGGRVMSLIDKAAAIAALRHSRTYVVTALVDGLEFKEPVRRGHILRLFAAVNAVFGSSMEVGVKVLSEDPLTGKQAHCCSAYATMVSLDAAGRPARAPRLLVSTAAERRREREAGRRRRERLRQRERGTKRTASRRRRRSR
jgi:acyl-CoA hydrolase